MLSESEARGASKRPRSKVAIAAHAYPGIAKPFLSKEELCIALNVSPRTIEHWTRSRRIPFLRLSKRMLRFSLPRVEAALNRYEVREVGARR